MKIESIDIVSNSQHRLTAEQARKATTAADEAAQTLTPPNAETRAAVRSSAETKADAPYDEKRDLPDPAGDGRGSPASQDRASLRAEVQKVRDDLEELGLMPPPTRFAGLDILSSAELIQVDMNADAVATGGVSATDRAQLQMVRSLLRRMLGAEVTVSLPGDLAAAQAPPADAPLAEDLYSVTAAADSGWAEPLPDTEPQGGQSLATVLQIRAVVDTSDGQSVSVAVAVEVGGADVRDAGERDEPMRIRFDGPASAVPTEGLSYRVDLDAAPHPADGSGAAAVMDDLHVWSTSSPDQDRLLAFGSKDSGVVYVGHLTGSDATGGAWRKSQAARADAAAAAYPVADEEGGSDVSMRHLDVAL